MYHSMEESGKGLRERLLERRGMGMFIWTGWSRKGLSEGATVPGSLWSREGGSVKSQWGGEGTLGGGDHMGKVLQWEQTWDGDSKGTGEAEQSPMGEWWEGERADRGGLGVARGGDAPILSTIAASLFWQGVCTIPPHVSQSPAPTKPSPSSSTMPWK